MTPTRQARIDWLLEHESAWAGFPDDPLLMGGQWMTRWRELVRVMKRRGLFSLSTHWADIGIPGLIRDARRQRRARKGQPK